MPYTKETSYADVELTFHGTRTNGGKTEPYSYPVRFTTVNATQQTAKVKIDTLGDFFCDRITHAAIGGATVALKFGAGLAVQIKDTEGAYLFPTEVALVNVSAPGPIGSGQPVVLPLKKRFASGGEIEVQLRVR